MSGAVLGFFGRIWSAVFGRRASVVPLVTPTTTIIETSVAFAAASPASPPAPADLPWIEIPPARIEKAPVEAPAATAINRHLAAQLRSSLSLNLPTSRRRHAKYAAKAATKSKARKAVATKLKPAKKRVPARAAWIQVRHMAVRHSAEVVSLARRRRPVAATELKRAA